jgi:hypothetical protein
VTGACRLYTVGGALHFITIRTDHERGIMSDVEISVTIPAESRFVALTRMAVASLATELDFTIAEIDDLRIGTDELVAALIEWAQDHGAPRVALTYRLAGDVLELSGRVEGGSDGAGSGDDDLLDDLTRRIFEGVVDEYEISPGGGRVLKRREAG